MRHNKLSLFIHLVWTTWDRLPLLTPEIERVVWRSLHHEAQNNGCVVLAIGGTEDHVHLLLQIAPTLSISDLVKSLKGVSSRLTNSEFGVEPPFKWQASYGAFSVSRWDVSKIVAYIRSQKEHHQSGNAKAVLKMDN